MHIPLFGAWGSSAQVGWVARRVVTRQSRRARKAYVRPPTERNTEWRGPLWERTAAGLVVSPAERLVFVALPERAELKAQGGRKVTAYGVAGFTATMADGFGSAEVVREMLRDPTARTIA